MKELDGLWRLPAWRVRDLLHRREITPLDLVDTAAARIAATEPLLNALPTRCVKRARHHARRLVDAPPPFRPGSLGGIPLAIKDLTDVAGVRTTYGSAIFTDHVPAHSDILVERLEANGGIVIAKSNTPEFGAGASTFNDVFGITRNPWNTAKSVAGSSGGACAAVAAGQVWLANGSDLGGSLRTPASFNSVVGLRPSPGRVAHGPDPQPFSTLPVEGPVARNVRDVALLLDAMSGHHPVDPLSFDDATSFEAAAVRAAPPQRVAFSPDLGVTPVDPQVTAICAQAAGCFTDLGVVVDDTAPDFSGARETFQTLRAALFAASLADTLRTHRAQLKPEVVWNIEQGLAISAADLRRAESMRAALYQRVQRFFQTYDLLLCPTAIVPPFAAEQRYVEAIDGHHFDNYVDWLAITFVVTLTACPALSLPVGFTGDGLPVGLQLIGPPRGEARLLSAAACLEASLAIADRVPIDPRPA